MSARSDTGAKNSAPETSTSLIENIVPPLLAICRRAVSAIFPGVITSPYLMTGCSDSRFMARVCDHCLRFTPFLIDHEQMDTIHGLNENVDVSCLAPAVDFYKYLMENR